jgi:hypothetical protein
MRSKLAFSALVVASLVGSTFAASAQSQPAPGASGQGNVGPGTTQSEMKNGKSGMTTGSGMNSGTGMNNAKSSSKTTGANPSGQGNVGPGTNQAGSIGNK